MVSGKQWSLAPRLAAVVFAAVSAAACGAEQEDETGAMDEMPGMPSEREPGTEMAGGDRMQMMQQMRTHMQYMSGVAADSLMGVMPMHRQMMGQMLEGMDPGTMPMGARSDSVWNATLDSVRNDVTRMERMSAAELREIMPAHRARVERLMSMHDSVMGTR
jgi:hypothetical protein